MAKVKYYGVFEVSLVKLSTNYKGFTFGNSRKANLRLESTASQIFYLNTLKNDGSDAFSIISFSGVNF